MRVLVVSPKFHPIIGGGETYVLNSVKSLHDAGIDVSVAVEPNPTRDVQAYPYKVYEVPGLSDTKLDVLQAPSNLHALIEELQPDIIHAHGYFALLALGLSSKDHVPIIASIHSTPVWGTRIIGGMDSFETELNFARKVLAMSSPDLLTAANKVYAAAALKIAEGRFNVQILPYPVDTDFFQKQESAGLRTELGLTSTDQLVLVPSRIIERKGIKEAIFALSELPENFYLCLPGAVEPLDQEYWAGICASRTYQSVQHRVIVPKQRVLYDKMPELYGACDIVAMPSYYAGAPVATVEAMSVSKPFVGADTQGINSFIRHQANGLLVPKGDASLLAQAIIQLSQDQSLSKRLSNQARLDIMDLSWDAQLPVLLATYNELLAARKARQPAFL